jgi:hypothetical protein
MKQHVRPYILESPLAKVDTQFQYQTLGRTFRPNRKETETELGETEVINKIPFSPHQDDKNKDD